MLFPVHALNEATHRSRINADAPGRAHRHLGGEGNHCAQNGQKVAGEARNHCALTYRERIERLERRDGQPKERPKDGQSKRCAKPDSGQPVAPGCLPKELDGSPGGAGSHGAPPEEKHKVEKQDCERAPAEGRGDLRFPFRD